MINDINDWLAEENGENDGIGDILDELCGEEGEIDSNPREECLEKELQSEEPEDNVNWQQIYGPRKRLTPNRNAHDIDSSLDEKNYKDIVYMNKDLEFWKNFVVILAHRKTKSQRKFVGVQSIQ